MSKKVTISFKVAPELKLALQALATEDGRSLSQYIDRVLTSHAGDHRPRKTGGKGRTN